MGFGLYIHVPYCRTVCPYCDFNVVPDRSAGTSQWDDYFQAVTNEWEARRGGFDGPVQTIYFGGGTPSLAPPEKVAAFLSHVRDTALVLEEAEVTLEADPGTVTREGLAALREAGVNRLSLGWQSTDDGLLKVLGRGHREQENQAVLKAAREAGFGNVSVDLMFGVPGQSLEGLRRTVGEIVAANPEHVSLYGLTYHEGTPFEGWRRSGKLEPVEDDTEALMMATIDSLLGEAGYEHYEVSNYGRAGFRSRHNQSYWRGVPYLGIGPGAHSFAPGDWTCGRRWEAVRNPKRYAAMWKERAGQGVPEEGDARCEWVEELSEEQLGLERLMVGLRTKDGVDLREVCSGALAERAEAAAIEAEARGWVGREGTRVLPTPLGMQMGDSLASLFFE